MFEAYTKTLIEGFNLADKKSARIIVKHNLLCKDVKGNKEQITKLTECVKELIVSFTGDIMKAYEVRQKIVKELNKTNETVSNLGENTAGYLADIIERLEKLEGDKK